MQLLYLAGVTLKWVFNHLLVFVAVAKLKKTNAKTIADFL